MRARDRAPLRRIEARARRRFAAASVVWSLVAVLALTAVTVAAAPTSAHAAVPPEYAPTTGWSIAAAAADGRLPGDLASAGDVVVTNDAPAAQNLILGTGGYRLDGVDVPRVFPSQDTIDTNGVDCVNVSPTQARPVGQINTCSTSSVTITLPRAVVDPIISVNTAGGGSFAAAYCTEFWHDLAFTEVNGAAVSGRLTPIGGTGAYAWDGARLSIPQSYVDAQGCTAFLPGRVDIRISGLVRSFTLDTLYMGTVASNPSGAAVGASAIGGTALNVLVPMADLAVTKTTPADVSAGGDITWTINVENRGPGDSHGFRVHDVLPEGLTNAELVTAPPGCTLAGRVLECAVAPPGCTIAQDPAIPTFASLACDPAAAADTVALAAGATFGPIVLTATAPPDRGTLVANTATVSGADPDPEPVNNTATVSTRVVAPRIQVVKDVAGRRDPLDQFVVSVDDPRGAAVTQATTRGSESTATSPLVQVERGTTYTISETMAAGSPGPLSDYAASLSCVDLVTGTSVPSSGAGPWTFTPPADGDYACTVSNTPDPRSYSVRKTADRSVVDAGDVVTYRVSVTNTGDAAYTSADPASFSDDLSDVLDDARYNGDATSGAAVAGSTLSWAGALAVGETVTVTYSVTTRDPLTGDGILANAVVPDGGGGACASADACVTRTPVRAYTIVKSVDTDAARAGQVVRYTVTLANSGRVAFTENAPASFRDDLSGVVDDAIYNADATQGAMLIGSTLLWSGPLPLAETITISYSVTVHDAAGGDGVLDNIVAPGSPAGSCAGFGACDTSTPLMSYEVSKTVSTAQASRGARVAFTIAITNTGRVDYTEHNPASFTDDLSDVLSSAAYNDDASSGAVFLAPTLSWSGPVAVGETVRVTYSVTVTAATGVLRNDVVAVPGSGSSCADSATGTGCVVTTTILPPGLASTGGTVPADAVLVGGAFVMLGIMALIRARRRRPRAP